MADQNAQTPEVQAAPPSAGENDQRSGVSGQGSAVRIQGKKIVVAVVGALVLVVSGIAACSVMNRGPTEDETRLQDLAMIAGILESYKQRTGAYPQPTLRKEDASGVRHVWGYRPGVSAQASCTLVVDERGNADARISTCGGDVYSSEGKVIGWKGTITVESALNVLKSAKEDIPPESPLSAFAPGGIPIDPQYRGTGTVEQQGFGEYVYAVLAPQDGSLERGGLEYQIAATVRDASSGELKTFIRGTYFASADRPSLPGSLIGSGPFMDEHRRPVSPNLFHVLVHGQSFSAPHPDIGQGEDLLERLRIQNGLEGVRGALDRRLAFLKGRSPLTRSEQVFSEKLGELAEEGRRVEREYSGGQGELQRFSERVQESSIALAAVTEDFLRGKAEEVREVLVRHQDSVILGDGIRSMLKVIRASEEQLLLARDDILRYLGGEGIEDQVRARAVRKVKTALENLEGLQGTDLPLITFFLTEQEQAAIAEILESEVSLGRPEPVESSLSNEEEEVLPKGKVLVIEILSSIRQLTDELTIVLNDVATELQVPGVLLGDIDRRFRLLLTALSEELTGIEKRLKNLAGKDDVAPLLVVTDDLTARGDVLAALQLVSRASSQSGDFSGISFPASFLNAIQLRPQAGVPDLDKVSSAAEASYSGIPYPLPGLNELYLEMQNREEQRQLMREDEVRKKLEEKGGEEGMPARTYPFGTGGEGKESIEGKEGEKEEEVMDEPVGEETNGEVESEKLEVETGTGSTNS